MKQETWLVMQKEKRAAARAALAKMGRGRAVQHKRNYVCFECRKCYNQSTHCPVHKTELIWFIGELPRRASNGKWAKLQKTKRKTVTQVWGKNTFTAA